MMSKLDKDLLERLEELNVDIKFPVLHWNAFMWGYAILVVVDKPYKKTYISPIDTDGYIIIPPTV